MEAVHENLESSLIFVRTRRSTSMLNWPRDRYTLYDWTDSARLTQLTKGEMSAKTTYQRSAKGPVAISECSADGKYITIENTGRKVKN